VSRQAGAGYLAKVQTNVVAVWVNDPVEHADHLPQDLRALEQLLIAQLGQRCLVGLRGDEQVTVCIRIAVQHRYRV